jgi:hypothetical protein
MKKHFLPIVIISVIAVLVQFESCKNTITGYNLTDLRAVIPTHVGISWTYLDITPSSLPSFPPDSTVVSTTVDSYFDSAGTRFYKLTGLIGQSDVNYFEAVTSTSYQRFVLNNSTLQPAGTILKTPVQQGTRWASNDKDSTQGYVEIANMDTTVQTPAGQFKNVICVREHWPGGSQWFILPAVGIVYETHSGDMTVTRQLQGKNF